MAGTVCVKTKTTGCQPAGEAVTGAALSIRSCRAVTNVGVHTCAETYQQHGRTQAGQDKIAWCGVMKH